MFDFLKYSYVLLENRIFSAFVVGYSINTHEANIKDVVKQTPQDILFVTFCIGVICGVLLEAVILLKR